MVTQKKWIPEPLLDELIEVADSAAALTEAIRSSNELPKHFPKSALLDICNSLGALKDGTLDGCRVPLEYAKARLPAIRREFIVRQVEDVDGSGTLEPTLQRGARVDIAFHQVIAAVATAWDEYRRTSTEDVSESEDIDPEVDSIHAVKSNVIEESIVVGKQLNERLEKIEGYSEQSSTNAEKLIRTIRDAENLNKLASPHFSHWSTLEVDFPPVR